MDPQNRRTASSYINNLLLSRGLLRNGVPIDFATPGSAEGGLDATMGQVMTVIHDLILRRDRESDTLANLSQSLQTLRASSAQQTQNITRLENRNADLDRQFALTGAQERSARATLRSAETRNRALREEMTRLKGTVAQIRVQCATDIRRRDGEIQRLKRHLEGRRGRDGNGGPVGVVIVTPGMNKGPQAKRNGEMEPDLESPAYSLKQETTDFLTQLSQGLSDENDALIGLVRGTLATLRSLQGLSEPAQGPEMDGSLDEAENVNAIIDEPPSYEALATSTDEVLEHLRGLLTNPSFVPLEEVEIREEEIQRLREGWETMAARWKEAVALMDGWKKRMVDTGDTINLDDLKVGLNLGSAIPIVQEAQEKSFLEQDEEIEESSGPAILEDLSEDLEEPFVDNVGADLLGEVDRDVHVKRGVLDNIDVNARPGILPRNVSFELIPEENTVSLANDEDVLLPGNSTYKAGSPSKLKSRIPSQTQPTASSPIHMIQQKLDRAEAEASEIRRQEESRPRKNVAKNTATKKLKGSRRRSTLSPTELENLVMGIL